MPRALSRLLIAVVVASLGCGESGPLEPAASADGGARDAAVSASADVGSADAAQVRDAFVADASPRADADPADAPPSLDAAPLDAGAPADAGHEGDAASEDAANEDATSEDAANEDAANEDAASEDAANEDAANEDAANEDAANEDAASEDAAPSDAGRGDTGVTFPGQRIFVTSVEYSGDLAALGGPDAICDRHAAMQGLGAGYRALLSTTLEDARDHVIVLGAVYNMAGQLVATSLNDLFDQNITSSVLYDEAGAMGPSEAWTATDGAGLLDAFGNCLDWTSGAGDQRTTVGYTRTTSHSWLDDDDADCNELHALYCLGPN